MAPKVLSGTTLGPQMAIKIHHRVPQNSPRALPSWPPSHTLAIISNFHSFLVPPSLELGSLGDARDRFWKPPGVNLRANCHFIQLLALPWKLRASNLRGSAGRAEPIKSAAPLGVQGVLNALSDSCQFLSDSKSLLWPPPCPPTLPQICAHSPRGRPKPPTLSILSRLFAVRKLIKNQTPQKTSPNRKIPILERQMSEF